MMCAPVFRAPLWQQGYTSYPSVMRVLLQTRDLTWYLLVQLGMVRNDAHTRRRFMAAVTHFADAEDSERENRRTGDAGPLVRIMEAYKKWVLMLADVQESLIMDEEERERERSVSKAFTAMCRRTKKISARNSSTSDSGPLVTREASEGFQEPSEATIDAALRRCIAPEPPSAEPSGTSDKPELKKGRSRGVTIEEPEGRARACTREKPGMWSKLKANQTRARSASFRMRRGSIEFTSVADRVRTGTLELLKAIEESAEHRGRQSTGLSHRGSVQRESLTPASPSMSSSPTKRAQQKLMMVSSAAKDLFLQRETPQAVHQKIRLRRARQSFLRELREMLILDVTAIGDSLSSLASDPSVLQSLNRTLTTNNPTGEPQSPEACRQLIFFANSLHNRRLSEPPPVQQMKSWTVFTPHYSEEVRCHTVQLAVTRCHNESANLYTILRALHPIDWDAFKERCAVVEIEQGVEEGDGAGGQRDDAGALATEERAKQVKVIQSSRASLTEQSGHSMMLPSPKKPLKMTGSTSSFESFSCATPGSRFSVMDIGLTTAVKSQQSSWELSEQSTDDDFD
eukprot:806651-Prymnesium_polylepis.1